MSNEGFEEELDQVYKQYRHSELNDRLNEVANIMGETILQGVLASTIFEIEIEIDEDKKQAVQEMNMHIERNNFEKIEEEIDELETEIEKERHRINVKIQDIRSDMADQVSGMKKLNQRLEQVDEEILDDLADLFNNWDWKEDIYNNKEENIRELGSYTQEYGSDVRQSYDQAKEKLFGPYEGTELEEIVKGLLNEERFALNNLSDDQLEHLRESELEEHVELSLS